MPDAASPEGPAEVVRALIRAAVNDKDEAAVRALLTKASLEGGSFNAPPDADKMQIEFGEAREENGEWTVPVTITNHADPDQPPMTMPFAPVIEDGLWKVDMNRTMERLFGGSMQAMVEGIAEGMSQAMQGIGEAMAAAFSGFTDEGIGRLPEDSTPEFAEAVRAFEQDELPRELAPVNEVLGTQFHIGVDWNSLGGDPALVAEVLEKGVRPVCESIRRVCTDEATKANLRRQMSAVELRNGGTWSSGISYMMGTWQLSPGLGAEAGPAGALKADDLTCWLRSTFDSEYQKAVGHFENEVVAPLIEQARERLGVEIGVEVDVASFTAPFDSETARRNLQRLEDEILRNFLYVLREVHQKAPIDNIAFKVQHTMHAKDRALFARGPDVVLRICLAQDGGAFSASDLESILPGVVSSVPDYSNPAVRYQGMKRPAPDPDRDAFAIITEYRDEAMSDLSGSLQQAAGKGLEIQCDWASLGEDRDAARNLTLWGLNRAIGALRLLARDPAVQQDMADTLNGFRLVGVATPEEKKIEVAGGMVNLHVCLREGEAGAFYERDIAQSIVDSMGTERKPVIAGIREAARYWEQALREAPGATVAYSIDFAGFTSHPDENRNRFSLSLLKEHGVDAIYYAASGLCEKNPNFNQQFVERVRRFVVFAVPEETQKGIYGSGDAICTGLYLFEGYRGYLTIEDLKKALPKIVAEMEPPPPPEPEPAVDAGTSSAAEESSPHVSYGVPEPEDDDGGEDGGESMPATEVPTRTAEQDDTFRQMVAQIEPMLPSYGQSLAMSLGRTVPVSIDWDTLDGDPIAIGALLNAGLGTVMGGVVMAAQEPGYRDDLARFLTSVRMRRAQTAQEQGLVLDTDGLTVSVFIEDGQATPLPTEEASAVFKALIDQLRASGLAEKEEPKKKAKKGKGAKGGGGKTKAKKGRT